MAQLSQTQASLACSVRRGARWSFQGSVQGLLVDIARLSIQGSVQGLLVDIFLQILVSIGHAFADMFLKLSITRIPLFKRNVVFARRLRSMQRSVQQTILL